MIKFTPKESDIIELFMKGDSHQTIADKLNITVRTCDYHFTNIYRKTGCKGKIQLVLWFHQRRLHKDVDTIT